MGSVALSGNDTVILNNHIFTDFADGNIAELTFPNKIANAKTGKNGNTIYSFNATGKQGKLVLRVLRGSNDDKFLNNLLAQQQNNFYGFNLMFGEFIKQIGDGAGNVSLDTYEMSGGIFDEQVGAKSNTDGDIEQSVAVYNFIFSNVPRILT